MKIKPNTTKHYSVHRNNADYFNECLLIAPTSGQIKCEIWREYVQVVLESNQVLHAIRAEFKTSTEKHWKIEEEIIVANGADT